MMAKTPEDYDILYNRFLDVSACFNIPVNVFAMFVVIKYTPNKLRHHSYFILDAMFWNFMTNLVFAFMHPKPQFPAECLRWDGLTNLVVDSERFGHVLFLILYVSICNFGIPMGTAFPYRFISFAYPQFAARIKPVRVVMFFCGAHVSATVMVLTLDLLWMIQYDDYPNNAELPERSFVICFRPDGYQKLLVFSSHLLTVGGYILVITIFSILIILKLRSETDAFHPQTFALQKKLFVNLVITTSIALVFGGVPVFFIIFTLWCPHIPYSRYIVMVCLVILSNHGTIYAVAYLVLFKAYRDAVKQIFVKFTRLVMIDVFPYSETAHS